MFIFRKVTNFKFHNTLYNNNNLYSAKGNNVSYITLVYTFSMHPNNYTGFRTGLTTSMRAYRKLPQNAAANLTKLFMGAYWSHSVVHFNN